MTLYKWMNLNFSFIIKKPSRSSLHSNKKTVSKSVHSFESYDATDTSNVYYLFLRWGLKKICSLCRKTEES